MGGCGREGQNQVRTAREPQPNQVRPLDNHTGGPWDGLGGLGYRRSGIDMGHGIQMDGGGKVRM